MEAIECDVHGCDVLNKRGCARPYVLSEHTLVTVVTVVPYVKVVPCVTEKIEMLK